MAKHVRSYTADVHAIIKERFCNAEPFSCHDIIKVAPWLEDIRSDVINTATSHVSAALSSMCRYGAVLLFVQDVNKDTGKKTNFYITDETIIDIYVPQRSTQ